MRHRSLIHRINDFLAATQPSGKTDSDLGSMAEKIMKEFHGDEDFNHRIVSVASRFAAEGLDTASYLKAALKQPPLFCQSPETVEANIRGLTTCFSKEGLDTAAYLKAALKQPSLFCHSPDTIAQHMTIIRDIYTSGCCRSPQGSIWEFLCSL